MTNYPATCSEIHTHTTVINGNAYTFGGKCGCDVVNTVRAYNIATNTWNNIGTINGGNPPTDDKAWIFVFSINDTIYYGAGSKWDCDPTAVFSEVYRYTPSTNTHTYLGNAPFSGGKLAYFSIGRYGYVFANTTLWRYNPDTNTWTEVCTPVKDAPNIAFATGNKAYIIDTDDDNGDGIKEFWEWIP